MSPLLTIPAAILIAVLPAFAGPTEIAEYRQRLELAFQQGTQRPSPPNEPLPPDLAALAALVERSQSGTLHGDPVEKEELRKVIATTAAEFSPSSPAAPPPPVLVDYLSRMRGAVPAAGSPHDAPSFAPRDDRLIMNRAIQYAAALGQGKAADGLVASGVPPAPYARRPGSPGSASAIRLDSPGKQPPPPLPPSDGPQAPGRLQSLGAWSVETAKGYGTGTANLVFDTANLINKGVNAGLSLTPIEFRFRTDMNLAPASAAEANAQQAIGVASLLMGVGSLVDFPAAAARLGRASRALSEIPRTPLAGPTSGFRRMNEVERQAWNKDTAGMSGAEKRETLAPHILQSEGQMRVAAELDNWGQRWSSVSMEGWFAEIGAKPRALYGGQGVRSKIIYTDPKFVRQTRAGPESFHVVYDQQGHYFRLERENVPGRYLMMDRGANGRLIYLDLDEFSASRAKDPTIASLYPNQKERAKYLRNLFEERTHAFDLDMTQLAKKSKYSN